MCHVTPDPLLIGKWDFCVSSQPQIARTPSFETRRDRDKVKTPQDASEKSNMFDPQASLTTSVGYPALLSHSILPGIRKALHLLLCPISEYSQYRYWVSAILSRFGIPRLDVRNRNMQIDTFHVIRKLEVLLYIENVLQINNAFYCM